MLCPHCNQEIPDEEHEGGAEIEIKADSPQSLRATLEALVNGGMPDDVEEIEVPFGEA